MSAAAGWLVLLGCVAQGFAQAPRPEPWRDWTRTYALAAGRKVRVETFQPKRKLRGRFLLADASGISIELADGRRETIAPDNVRKVLAERERMKYAPLIGMAGGGLVFTGVALRVGDLAPWGVLMSAGFGAGLGALAGWGVGALGRHALIYEAPKPGKTRSKRDTASPLAQALAPAMAEPPSAPHLPDDPKPAAPRLLSPSSPSSHSTAS